MIARVRRYGCNFIIYSINGASYHLYYKRRLIENEDIILGEDIEQINSSVELIFLKEKNRLDKRRELWSIFNYYNTNCITNKDDPTYRYETI